MSHLRWIFSLLAFRLALPFVRHFRFSFFIHPLSATLIVAFLTVASSLWNCCFLPSLFVAPLALFLILAPYLFRPSQAVSVSRRAVNQSTLQLPSLLCFIAWAHARGHIFSQPIWCNSQILPYFILLLLLWGLGKVSAFYVVLSFLQWSYLSTSIHRPSLYLLFLHYAHTRGHICSMSIWSIPFFV